MSTPTPPWTFDETQVTFDNPGYKWDGSVPTTPPPPPSPFATVNVNSDRVIYPAVVAGSVKILPTDFISLLQQGETVNSATASARVYSGIDGNPSALITGAPSVSGTIVNIQVSPLIIGVTYEIRIVASTSLLQNLILCGYLTVVPDLL